MPKGTHKTLLFNTAKVKHFPVFINDTIMLLINSGTDSCVLLFKVGKEEMTVVWAPPENDGGKSITGYILERKEKRAVRWVPCTKSTITERRMKVTNLIPNHEYQFRVRAENEVGLGEPSKPCRAVAAKDPIGGYSMRKTSISYYLYIAFIILTNLL